MNKSVYAYCDEFGDEIFRFKTTLKLNKDNLPKMILGANQGLNHVSSKCAKSKEYFNAITLDDPYDFRPNVIKRIDSPSTEFVWDIDIHPHYNYWSLNLYIEYINEYVGNAIQSMIYTTEECATHNVEVVSI